MHLVRSNKDCNVKNLAKNFNKVEINQLVDLDKPENLECRII